MKVKEKIEREQRLTVSVDRNEHDVEEQTTFDTITNKSKNDCSQNTYMLHTCIIECRL